MQIYSVLRTVLLGVFMLICTTLHASQARSIGTQFNTDIGIYDQFSTELARSKNTVAFWIWPVLTMVASILYTILPDRSNSTTRFIVVVITLVTTVFIMNLWLLHDDRHSVGSEQRAPHYKDQFELYIRADMFIAVFGYIEKDPKFTVGVVVSVLLSASFHCPDDNMHKAKSFSRGNWAGMATRWVAIFTCCWYVQLMYTYNIDENTRNKNVIPVGSNDIVPSPQQMIDNFSDFWVSIWNIRKNVNEAAQDTPFVPTRTDMTGKLTTFMLPFAFICLAVGIFLPARSAEKQRLITGPVTPRVR